MPKSKKTFLSFCFSAFVEMEAASIDVWVMLVRTLFQKRVEKA